MFDAILTGLAIFFFIMAGSIFFAAGFAVSQRNIQGAKGCIIVGLSPLFLGFILLMVR